MDHVFFSQTRAWMALVMGATMAVIMLLFMLDMYTSRKEIAEMRALIDDFEKK